MSRRRSKSDDPRRLAETDQRVKHCNQCADLLGALAQSASEYGKSKLFGAHVYLYAAMLADFICDAERSDWIGPEVSTSEGGTEPTRQVITEYLFNKLFKPLLKENFGPDFLGPVEAKLTLILRSRPMPSIE